MPDMQLVDCPSGVSLNPERFITPQIIRDSLVQGLLKHARHVIGGLPVGCEFEPRQGP